jgi:hypothetical protein
MSVDGVWKVKMETPMGTREAVATLKAEGGTLTGTFGGDGGSTDIFDGTVSGNNVFWKAKIEQPMALTLEFSAAIDGDALAGSVKLGMFGNAPLSGVRA